MQIDSRLSFDDARKLSTRKRADLLASNRVAASTIFHRRVQSIFNNFLRNRLFGETKPFGEREAFLGRVEQQARHSPHLHLLIWTTKKSPSLTGNQNIDSDNISRFVELFSTALLPPDSLFSQDSLPKPPKQFPPPVYASLPQDMHTSPITLSGPQRHAALSLPYNAIVFNGSVSSNRERRSQIQATQLHTCNSYCKPQKWPMSLLFPLSGPRTRNSRSPQRKLRGYETSCSITSKYTRH